MITAAAIPVILGETASGKTSFGIQLAKDVDGEVISVDSRKVYKGLPIGTATPAGTWHNGTFLVEGVAHHLMGHLDPDQIYTAGDFAKDAHQRIDDIRARKRIPILVGGTGFYFKALAEGLPELPPRNDAFREKLARQAEAQGIEPLYERLKQIDPVAAAITHRDKHKIMRALEIFELTGQPFSLWKTQKKPLAQRPFVVLGVRYPKDLVEKRIEERSRQMFKDGMIEEAEAVLKKGYAPSCPALSSFGYKEAVQVIRGERPRSEFLPELIKGTKAYAKRQRTWFRTQTKLTWFECDASTTKEEISMKMKAFLEKSRN